MTVKAWTLGLAIAMATATGAMACGFSSKMTTAEIPKVDKPVQTAQVPVDLWLVPYLS